jgi:hypothetical protein
MPSKEGREYVSPLLQPPLNRLFIPCPRPDFLPQTNKKSDDYHGPRIGTVSEYMKYLFCENNFNINNKDKKSLATASEQKKRRAARNQSRLQKRIQKCNFHFPLIY